MEDLVPVFDKDAHALPIAEPRRQGPVVEDQGLELVCPEGDGVVEIEAVAMGGEPLEAAYKRGGLIGRPLSQVRSEGGSR